MDLIVFTRFVAPAAGASRFEIALGSLGAWFDAEIGHLEDLLDITGHEDAIDDLEILHALHLAADASQNDIRRLLETALASLERLLTRLRSIPRAGPADPVLDAWARRAAARLAETLGMLDRALPA